MKTFLRHWAPGLATALSIAAAASAQSTRLTVTVDRPENMPRVASEMVIEARARAAAIAAIVDGRLSPDVLRYRTEEARAAFEPVDSLLASFSVVSREDVDATHVRVICDADVALGGVFQRLIRSKVLTFLGRGPRILMLSSNTADMPAVKSLRSRLEAELSGSGVQFLDNEDATPGFVPRRTTAEGRNAIASQAQKLSADYVAVITITRERAPSPVGGYVVDERLQYTILRPHNLTILAEKDFTARGSGATYLLAEQDLLRQQGPRMARALSGEFVTALFADAEVVDPLTAPAPIADKTAPASRKTAAPPTKSVAPSTSAPVSAATAPVALASSSGTGTDPVRPPLILRRKIQ